MRGAVRFEAMGMRLRRYGQARWLAAAAAILWTVAVTSLLVIKPFFTRDRSTEAAAVSVTMIAVLLGILGVAMALGCISELIGAWRARRVVGSIEIGEEAITVEADGERVVLPHEAVSEGIFRPADRVVRLWFNRVDRLDIEPFDNRSADRLLDTLAAGATERALDLAVRRASAARIAIAVALTPICAAVIFVLAALESAGGVIGAAAALGVGWTLFVTRFGAPQRILVGHDGVALEGVRGQSFLPYRRILGVRATPTGVILEVADGAEIPVNLLRRAHIGLDLSARRRDALVAKIEAELKAADSAGDDLLGIAQLERGERSIAAWREGLRALTTRPTAGYRAASLDPEHLIRILETRAMAPERRLGAALALSSTEDPAVQRRLRVFIDSSASDALRGALEQAAEDELDEGVLAGALRQMDRS